MHHCADSEQTVGAVDVTGLDNVPSGGMEISTRSPSFSQTFGDMPIPTPMGVPVAMTSPGWIEMPMDAVAMSVGTSKMSS